MDGNRKASFKLEGIASRIIMQYICTSVSGLQRPNILELLTGPDVCEMMYVIGKMALQLFADTKLPPPPEDFTGEVDMIKIWQNLENSILVRGLSCGGN
jgi:hypothetical protein